MRRPRADREEKRVTHGNDMRREEQLDLTNPNQRGLLALEASQTVTGQRKRKSFVNPSAINVQSIQ